MEVKIAQELIQLATHDLAVREQLLQENKLSNGYNPSMEAVHRANAVRLREIIGQIGWPTRSKVGEEASEAAWLIVQHAIGEALFMKSCYELMIVVGDDINPQHLAYLYDRICFFTGKPQRYGTQYDKDKLFPVEDKAAVNKLRAEISLPIITEQRIAEAIEAGNPADLHTDADFREWRRKAGWLSE
ncbi:DUF6624 domain-containing protein [Spirosoma endbachense]|uniref:Uncharacterized protein n=1 Tax=Spirosoma endbachense TaxID=2666025 RepID=A0A6P1VYU2_9BACT|nr:DUF6624 domain-containing protein [Spirosoma endbachense]QHV96940.1 hypothetical protein GJR95_18850 [Spirosoma endbachense]